MKKVVLLLLSALLITASVMAQTVPNLPKKLHTEGWRAGHVQGIAVDTNKGYVYLSFTTMLVKVDMKGNVVGSVKGILGHLGCLDFNEEDGRVYGSLEYKNDGIGKGILKQEGVTKQFPTGFYIAIIDVDKINRLDMDAEKDGVITSVLLKTVVADYLAKVKTKSGNELDHRHGCSGIDGVSFGPAFDGSGKQMLTAAYGVYGDTNRADNDYQVLLQYDVKDWSKYATIHSQNNLHRNGPEQPDGKYFVFTGNTTWGVQNLEYDSHSGNWFLVCYPGKKPQYANYSLFCVDGAKKAKVKPLQGVDYQKKGAQLSLAKIGKADPQCKSVRGWHGYHKFGSYGIHALGDGYFYLTSAGRSKQGRSATLHLARFVGKDDKAFEMVK